METTNPVSTRFRILDLPAELRNHIYGYTLYHDRSSRHFANVNILSTCRQLYDEAKGLLFEHSAFSFTISDTGVTPELHASVARQIRKLVHSGHSRRLQTVDHSNVSLSGDVARNLGASSRLGVENIYDALPPIMLKVARVNLNITTGCAFVAQRLIYALACKLNSPQTRCSRLHIHCTARSQDDIDFDLWQGVYDGLLKLPAHITIELGKTLCPEDDLWELLLTRHGYTMSLDSYVRLCNTKDGKAHPAVPHFTKADTIARYKHARTLASGLITSTEARFKKAHCANDHKTREEIGRFWIEMKKRLKIVAQSLYGLNYWFRLEHEHDDLIDLEMVTKWASAVIEGMAIDEKALKEEFDAKRGDLAELAKWKEVENEEFKKEHLRRERASIVA